VALDGSIWSLQLLLLLDDHFECSIALSHHFLANCRLPKCTSLVPPPLAHLDLANTLLLQAMEAYASWDVALQPPPPPEEGWLGWGHLACNCHPEPPTPSHRSTLWDTGYLAALPSLYFSWVFYE